MKGKLVVVGGHSRGVGKTTVMRAVLHSLPNMNWHAVKISNHDHHHDHHRAAHHDDHQLLRLPDAEFATGISTLADQLSRGRNLLVESNRLASHLAPDLVIFVVNPLNPDWKTSSAACLDRAGALVFSCDGPCPAQLLSLRRHLPAFRLQSWNGPPPFGFREWLDEMLSPAEVTSHEIPVSPPPLHGPACVGANDGIHRSQARQMGQCAGAGFGPLPARGLELV